jgi:hypothetical protein
MVPISCGFVPNGFELTGAAQPIIDLKLRAGRVRSSELCGAALLALSKESPQLRHRRIPNDDGFKWISPWTLHLR